MDDAIKEYRKVIELSPDYSWAYYNIAQIYWELKRLDDAVIMLKKTIEKNPKDFEAYKLLAQILIKENKQDEALEILSEVSEKVENGDIYYLMSKIFEIDEDKNSQLDCLELALDNKNTLTFNPTAVNAQYKELKNASKN